jgi:hypothetical protein
MMQKGKVAAWCLGRNPRGEKRKPTGEGRGITAVTYINSPQWL